MKHREVLLLLLFNHSVMSDLLQPHRLYPIRLPCPWGFPEKNFEVACHVLPQGIFPAQGLNPCLLQTSSIASEFFTTEPYLVTYRKAAQTKRGLKPRHVHSFNSCWSTALCQACTRYREQSRKTTASLHWDFPDCSVVRSWCCHCWGPRSIPGWGTKILQVTGQKQTNKQNTLHNFCLLELTGGKEKVLLYR